MKAPSQFSALVLLLASSLFSGCAGYEFQRSENPLLLREGVQSIYIAPLINNTYKPGVENLVYNELVRTILAGQRIKIVAKPEHADAVLVGKVNQANFNPAGVVPSQNLYPPEDSKLPDGTPIPLEGPKNISIATEYGAGLGCDFSLERQVPIKGKTKVLWSSGFSRYRTFPGNNQKGVFGTTSPLINESEFDRALRDMAQSMMADLHESMLAMF